jgi:8-oxo-dGTP pyrophosphatase MutT (NUDIX family)
MVEVGEHAVQTMQREFTEEALNGQPMPDAAERLFHASSTVLYTGYVDDPRNTDHAWIETVCINVHDGTGKALGQLALQAGSDASAVAWVDASKVGLLYADHAAYVQEALALQRGLFVPRSQPMAVPIASLRNARHVR